MRILHALSPQLLVVALLTYLVASGGSYTAAPLQEGEQTVATGHVPGAPLSADTANGSITATKTDRRDVQIVAKIAAVSAERLAAAKIVLNRGADNTLTVRCEWPEGGPKDRESCSFDIQIPEAVGVTLISENGNVSSSHLAGDAKLLTTNGNVEIDHHAGPIRARTTNGSVTIDGAEGPVKTGTSNGAIDVALAPNSAGPIEADGVNSKIDLKVGPSFAGTLSLATTNGHVSIDPALRAAGNDPHDVQLDFGGDPQKSSATTVNGTIHVGLVDASAQQ